MNNFYGNILQGFKTIENLMESQNNHRINLFFKVANWVWYSKVTYPIKKALDIFHKLRYAKCT